MSGSRQRISPSSLAKPQLELPKHTSCKTEDSHHYHRYPISSDGSIAEDSADRSKCDDWKRNLEQAPGDALASEGGQHDEDQHRSTLAPRTIQRMALTTRRPYERHCSKINTVPAPLSVSVRPFLAAEAATASACRNDASGESAPQNARVHARDPNWRFDPLSSYRPVQVLQSARTTAR